MFGEFKSDMLGTALASPRSHHHIGILVLVPCGNHDGWQWRDNSFVAEVLAPLNGLHLDFLLSGILIDVSLTLLLLVSTGSDEQCACQYDD